MKIKIAYHHLQVKKKKIKVSNFNFLSYAKLKLFKILQKCYQIYFSKKKLRIYSSKEYYDLSRIMYSNSWHVKCLVNDIEN